MQLGPLTFALRRVDPFDAVSLVRARDSADEPEKSYCDLAALAMSTTCPGMPDRQPGQSYPAYGRDIRGWLTIKGAPVGQATMAGFQASRRLAREMEVQPEEVASHANFFGNAPLSSTDADSPAGTKGPPSEG